jgi:FixJ family two-component response regulator
LAFHVVEDDPAVADALVLMLTEFGHEACAYPDAESFLAATRPVSDDTVVVDLLLPGMSGADLVRLLRADGLDIRVVVVSGQTQAGLDRQLAGLGVIRLIRKPVEADAIRDLL